MKPRPYQTAAVEAVTLAIKTNKTVAAVLPTGSGKSLVEALIVDRLCDQLGFNQCVVVVSHLTDVVDQLHMAYLSVGRYAKKSMRMTGRHRPTIATKVVFATVQTLTSPNSREFWTTSPMRKDVPFCLVDEAHQFGTDSYDMLNNAVWPLAKWIGFSATPFRKNQYSFSQFDTVAYAIDSATLIRDGYLTPPRLFDMALGDLSTGEKFAALIRIWRETEQKRKLVTVVYLRSKDEAQELRLVAEQEGIKVEFVSGDSPEAFCRALYARARAGEIEMIVNCRKLETGIDIPNIGAVFMPFACNSVTSYLQRVGRALRPCPNKTEAHIYVFGSAPSVKSGKWSRIHRDALSAKDPLDIVANLEDDLLEQQENAAPAERIAWTKSAIEACQVLLAGKYEAVAKLVAERKFPKKYDRVISDLVKRMEILEPAVGSERRGASESQISILSQRHGFSESDMQKLQESEAWSILKALNDYYARSPFVLQSGPHAGKHISDTPPMYRRFIKDPANRSVWQRWIRAGSPKETECVSR